MRKLKEFWGVWWSNLRIIIEKRQSGRCIREIEMRNSKKTWCHLVEDEMKPIKKWFLPLLATIVTPPIHLKIIKTRFIFQITMLLYEFIFFSPKYNSFSFRREIENAKKEKYFLSICLFACYWCYCYYCTQTEKWKNMFHANWHVNCTRRIVKNWYIYLSIHI